LVVGGPKGFLSGGKAESSGGGGSRKNIGRRAKRAKGNHDFGTRTQGREGGVGVKGEGGRWVPTGSRKSPTSTVQKRRNCVKSRTPGGERKKKRRQLLNYKKDLRADVG